MTVLDALYEIFLLPPYMLLEFPFTLAFNLSGLAPVATVVMALVANLVAIPLHRRTKALGKIPAPIADVVWLGFAAAWLAFQEMTQTMFPLAPLLFAAITAFCCLLRWALGKRRLPGKTGSPAHAKSATSQAKTRPWSSLKSRLRGTAAQTSRKKSPAPARPSLLMHLCCCAFLIVLVGCVAPGTVLDRSAASFIDPLTYADPTWYLAHSLCQAIGAFGVWPTLLYAFSSDRGRVALNAAMLALCVAGLLNFLLVSSGQKRLKWTMEFVRSLSFDPVELVVNTLCVCALCLGLVAAWLRGFQVMRHIAPTMLVMATATMTVSFALTLPGISQTVAEETTVLQEQAQNQPSFTLSRTGKNVVVIMMDRALGTYFPFITEELPQLKEQFRGFTFYENTVSYSNKTNVASPCVYGGYDYTPERSYQNNHKKLVSKQNEALKVLPVLFKKNGYDVTVLDPTYANYGYVPDPSIFNKYGIPAYNAMYYYQDPDLCANVAANNKVNFFRYGLLRISPALVQGLIYGEGSWLRSSDFIFGREQTVDPSNQKSWGVKPDFVRSVNSLNRMEEMTTITDQGKGFLMMSNDAMHEPCILQRPDYTPEYTVDNTNADAESPRTLTVGNTTIEMTTYMQEGIYSCNAAGLLALGRWFDYLRAEGVWDNTRVIICADHGYDVFSVADRVIDADLDQLYASAQGDVSRFLDADAYHPLLLVKDFGENGALTTDETFMTHADVPSLAAQGAVRAAVNPFTGNPLAASKDQKKEVHVFATHNWNPSVNNGYTFGTDGAWFSVSKDMRKGSNWKLIDPPYDPKLLETQGPDPANNAGTK